MLSLYRIWNSNIAKAILLIGSYFSQNIGVLIFAKLLSQKSR